MAVYRIAWMVSGVSYLTADDDASARESAEKIDLDDVRGDAGTVQVDEVAFMCQDTGELLVDHGPYGAA